MLCHMLCRIPVVVYKQPKKDGIFELRCIFGTSFIFERFVPDGILSNHLEQAVSSAPEKEGASTVDSLAPKLNIAFIVLIASAVGAYRLSSNAEIVKVVMCEYPWTPSRTTRTCSLIKQRVDSIVNLNHIFVSQDAIMKEIFMSKFAALQLQLLGAAVNMI
uniref:Prohibitin n=1 Tax=Steinernema glaseri TaxID=37863 RepID=A0A1I7YC22_9BILA